MVSLAQESEELEYNQQLIELSTDKLEYSGLENTSLLRTFKVIGIKPGDINVLVFSGELYDTSSGKTFCENKIEISESSFTLTQNEEKKVSVTLTTSDGDKGVYQGKLIVTAVDVNNPTNVTYLELIVSANIKIEEKMSLEEHISNKGIWLISALMLIGLSIEKPWAKDKSKPFKIVSLGILAGLIYIIMLVNPEPGDTNSATYTAISTIFIAPLIGYAIKYVNDERQNWNETLKTARKIKTDGINKDVEIIRNLIGEFACHYSSLEPNLYEESHYEETPPPDKIVTFSRVLYQETGSIPDEYWKENRRDGMISNIPTLYLEKYYDFIGLYNKYYSCAIKLTKDENYKITFKLEDKKYVVDSIVNDDLKDDIFPFIREFENFRTCMSNLETVLYVYLLYNLGLISTSYLSPLKVEFPRVNRALLAKLIEYGVLIPKKYMNNEFNNWFKEERLFDKWSTDDKIRDRIKLTLDGELKNEFEQFKQHNSINDEEKKEAFLDFIDKWYADDKLRREIMKDIYQENKMYQFLRKVKADYKEKYQLTKISIGKLEPLKEKCLEEEKEKSITVNGAVKLELKDVENENSQKKYVLDT